LAELTFAVRAVIVFLIQVTHAVNQFHRHQLSAATVMDVHTLAFLSGHCWDCGRPSHSHPGFCCSGA